MGAADKNSRWQAWQVALSRDGERGQRAKETNDDYDERAQFFEGILLKAMRNEGREKMRCPCTAEGLNIIRSEPGGAELYRELIGSTLPGKGHAICHNADAFKHEGCLHAHLGRKDEEVTTPGNGKKVHWHSDGDCDTDSDGEPVRKMHDLTFQALKNDLGPLQLVD